MADIFGQSVSQSVKSQEGGGTLAHSVWRASDSVVIIIIIIIIVVAVLAHIEPGARRVVDLVPEGCRRVGMFITWRVKEIRRAIKRKETHGVAGRRRGSRRRH